MSVPNDAVDGQRRSGFSADSARPVDWWLQVSSTSYPSASARSGAASTARGAPTTGRTPTSTSTISSADAPASTAAPRMRRTTAPRPPPRRAPPAAPGPTPWGRALPWRLGGPRRLDQAGIIDGQPTEPLDVVQGHLFSSARVAPNRPCNDVRRALGNSRDVEPCYTIDAPDRHLSHHTDRVNLRPAVCRGGAPFAMPTARAGRPRRPRRDVARVVHACVHARERHDRGCGPQGQPKRRQQVPDGNGERGRGRGVARWNDVDDGIATRRCCGTPSRPSRDGRVRRPIFMGWFTTRDAAPTAASPASAPRRPRPAEEREEAGDEEPRLGEVREVGHPPQRRVQQRRGEPRHRSVGGTVIAAETSQRAGHPGGA